MPSSSSSTIMHHILHAIRDALDGFLFRLQQHVALRVAIGIFVIILMSNLVALVDLFLRPEIAYFDTQHIVVGLVTGSVTTVLFGMLSIYVASMKRAMREIKTLEGLLPICSRCNKIRTPDNRWDVLEKFIQDRTEATFTHSLCPDCARQLYPEMYAGEKPGERG